MMTLFLDCRTQSNSQIIGTVAIRKLKESVFADTNNFAELKRIDSLA